MNYKLIKIPPAVYNSTAVSECLTGIKAARVALLSFDLSEDEFYAYTGFYKLSGGWLETVMKQECVTRTINEMDNHSDFLGLVTFNLARYIPPSCDGIPAVLICY